jgi:hypothetical protein
MDFFKKLFGQNTNQQQDNFVVDENGVAKDVAATHATITEIPQEIAQPAEQNHLNQNSHLTQAPIQNLAPAQNPIGATNSIEEVFVGDTSAFDELMKQADNSVDLKMPETPIDPEFQKIKDEIAKEEGIEIFPAN